MKMTKASLAALLGMVLSAPAGAVSIANGSFETFTGAFGGDGGAAVSAGQTLLTGWSVILQTAVLETPNIYGLLPSTGTNFLDLTSYSSIGGGAVQGVEQLVSGLDLGEVYQVSLDLGVSNAPCVRGGVNCTGPISVQASAGGVSEVIVHNSAAPGNTWGTYGFQFTASSSSTTVRITMLSTPGYYVGLDNVAISAVPEATTIGMLS